MNINNIGLITYHYPHLKTEQVLQKLLLKSYKYKMFALPFKQRKQREILFVHRPEQSSAAAPQILAEKHGIPYIKCLNDEDIDDSCDVYLILGAGIISGSCIAGKKIINCHPGIIPACRGLDSFKWAIYGMKPMGITLHYIDAKVDAGEIVSVVPTNVYRTDSFIALARRHYENEIDCLSNFDEYLLNPINSFVGIEASENKMRMPLEKEKELAKRFSEYIELFG